MLLLSIDRVLQSLLVVVVVVFVARFLRDLLMRVLHPIGGLHLSSS